MKKLVIIVALMIGGISMESFWQQTAMQIGNERKIGVWKTYDDYAHGNLTDLGEVTENPNAWNDKGIFFDKEHIMPDNTKYWGARIPIFVHKDKSFVNRSTPLKNSSEPIRFAKGQKLRFMINPLPIGIYYSGDASARYTPEGEIQACSPNNGNIYASKGNGDCIYALKGNIGRLSQEEKEALKALFNDDTEIQTAYEAADAKIKGGLGSKNFIIFAKYAVEYNRKHTPKYSPIVKTYGSD